MAKKKKSSEAELSDDLIVEILIRSDYKTLIRSKCVSKTWVMMIASPSFSKRYNKAILTTGFFFGVSEKSGLTDDIGIDNQKFYVCGLESGSTDDMEIDMSLKFLKRAVWVVSSHNGFLLCAVKQNAPSFDKCDYEYIVCNPLTKQWVKVPKTGKWHRPHDTVLFTYENKKQAMEFNVFHRYCRSSVITYSSEKKKWIKSRLSGSTYNISNSVLFQESVYVCGSEGLLWGFNLESRVPFNIELPFNSVYSDYNCLGVSAGSLYYAATISSEKWIKVWVLVDMGEWTLKYNIKTIELHKKLPENIRSRSNLYYTCAFHPLLPCCILVESHPQGKGVFLYNTDTENVEIINYDTSSSVPYCLPTWTPSLVP